MLLRLNSVPTSTLILLSALALGGCFDDPTPIATASGSEATSGDGDGDPATGDGDGDGDPSTSGDGDGDSTTTGDGDGDGDPTTTGGPSCGVGMSCYVDPGPPWEGPFAVGDSCALNSYGVQLHELFSGLDPGDANCACQCGDPEVSCSTNMSVVGYGSANCVNGQGSVAIVPNQCYNTVSASHALSLSAASAECGAGEVVAEIPTPTFDVALLGCGVSESEMGGCGDSELCVPDPIEFEGGVCFSSPGDVTCPAGYPQKTIYATGFEDTRMCEDNCSCSPTGATCRVSVTGYASDNCVNGQGAIVVESGAGLECVASNAQVVQSIRPGSVTVQSPGTCAAQGDIGFGGEAVETGPLTVCCSG